MMSVAMLPPVAARYTLSASRKMSRPTRGTRTSPDMRGLSIDVEIRRGTRRDTEIGLKKASRRLGGPAASGQSRRYGSSQRPRIVNVGEGQIVRKMLMDLCGTDRTRRHDRGTACERFEHDRPPRFETRRQDKQI